MLPLVTTEVKELLGVRHPVRRGNLHVYVLDEYVVACRGGWCVGLSEPDETLYESVLAVTRLVASRALRIVAPFDARRGYKTVLLVLPGFEESMEPYVVRVGGSKFVLACEKLIDVLGLLV